MTEIMHDAGIFRQIQDKEEILKEVINRTYEEENQKHGLDHIILDTAYNEIQRLENARKSPEEKEELSKWRKMYKRMLNMSEEEKVKTLREITSFYANDIIGNFNPKVYKFTTKLLPSFMSIFFRSINLKSMVIGPPNEDDIDKIVLLSGQIKELQALSKKGTIILVPTHLSNMDSIVIGWALYRIGLPPFTYGAGKNLFTNWLLSYFMHNLGAYRVDRRIRNDLYKNVLKNYSTVILEKNYHSLFFPGGTRARSGGVENKLKLGLLGTSVKAYINNLKNNKENPNIYVVPCTINYHITLEAETLIDDYLKDLGKARYIIEDDEFSSFAKVINFLFKTASMQSTLHIRFGSAFDLFGNKVDIEGKSYDSHGREVDPKRYVISNGEIVHSEQRDSEYTKELGDRIIEEFFKNNVILSTHIIAFCIFNYLQKLYPKMDLYRLVKLTPEEATINKSDLYPLIEKVKEEIKNLESQNKISMDPVLRVETSQTIMSEALRNFNTYYADRLLIDSDDNLILNDIKVIYYYHNRLKGYSLEKII
jgi:glycerol-3-phosphate O-acyltransferase